MTLPSSDTPLYNHPLPEIEQWLIAQGCQQSEADVHCWHVQRSTWQAELCLDIEQMNVRYFNFGEGDRVVQRSFKYSLTRRDIEDAIFSGP